MSAALLVTLLTQFQNCTVLTDVNGCSVPFGIDVPFKDVFTPACLNHDVCFRCVGLLLEQPIPARHTASEQRCYDVIIMF